MDIYKQIYKKIKKYKTIYIFGHKNADGDCIGSQLGLAKILQEKFPKKTIKTVGEKCEYVSFLGSPDFNIAEPYLLKTTNKALGIILDCSDQSRISSNEYKICKEIINIDHHTSVSIIPFGNIYCIETNAPACAQIITEFAIANKLNISKLAAMCLYTGIVTDSGRFKFPSVDSKTMSLAAQLLATGVKVNEIDELLNNTTKETLRFNGYILSHIKYTKNGIAYVKLTKETLEKYKVNLEEATTSVNLLRYIKDYPVYFLAAEYPDKIRISLRSTGPAIAWFAAKYKGGGHDFAAGCSLDSWTNLEEFLSNLDSVVKQYKLNPEEFQKYYCPCVTI